MSTRLRRQIGHGSDGHKGEAMTEDEFRTMWLRNSKMTLADARRYGRMVVPCDCAEDGCQGWGMIHTALLDEYELNALSEPYRTRARRLRPLARATLGLKVRP